MSGARTGKRKRGRGPGARRVADLPGVEHGARLVDPADDEDPPIPQERRGVVPPRGPERGRDVPGAVRAPREVARVEHHAARCGNTTRPRAADHEHLPVRQHHRGRANARPAWGVRHGVPGARRPGATGLRIGIGVEDECRIGWSESAVAEGQEDSPVRKERGARAPSRIGIRLAADRPKIAVPAVRRIEDLGCEDIAARRISPPEDQDFAGRQDARAVIHPRKRRHRRGRARRRDPIERRRQVVRRNPAPGHEDPSVAEQHRGVTPARRRPGRLRHDRERLPAAARRRVVHDQIGPRRGFGVVGPSDNQNLAGRQDGGGVTGPALDRAETRGLAPRSALVAEHAIERDVRARRRRPVEPAEQVDHAFGIGAVREQGRRVGEPSSGGGHQSLGVPRSDQRIQPLRRRERGSAGFGTGWRARRAPGATRDEDRAALQHGRGVSEPAARHLGSNGPARAGSRVGIVEESSREHLSAGIDAAGDENPSVAKEHRGRCAPLLTGRLGIRRHRAPLSCSRIVNISSCNGGSRGVRAAENQHPAVGQKRGARGAPARQVTHAAQRGIDGDRIRRAPIGDENTDPSIGDGKMRRQGPAATVRGHEVTVEECRDAVRVRKRDRSAAVLLVGSQPTVDRDIEHQRSSRSASRWRAWNREAVLDVGAIGASRPEPLDDLRPSQLDSIRPMRRLGGIDGSQLALAAEALQPEDDRLTWCVPQLEPRRADARLAAVEPEDGGRLVGGRCRRPRSGQEKEGRQERSEHVGCSGLHRPTPSAP